MPKSFMLNLAFICIEFFVLIIVTCVIQFNPDLGRYLIWTVVMINLVHIISMFKSMQKVKSAIENRDMESINDAFSNLRHMMHGSEVDLVTGCYNRYYFDIVYGKYTKNNSLLIAFFDVNGLKQINDTYGHEYGDILLKTFSEKLRELDKYGDIYRWGGDEFVFIANNASDNIKEKIENWYNEKKINPDMITVVNKITHEESKTPVVFAMGISYREVGNKYKLEDLIVEADANMYDEKRRIKGEIK